MYCTLISLLYLHCELSPRFPLLSVRNICIHFQKVAILSAVGWVFISGLFLFFFSFNSFEGEGNIQLQNIACFYINQILFA